MLIVSYKTHIAHLPEADDDLVTFRVATVVGVFLPVINIDIRNTTNEKLEFSLIEDVH
jgi:hypothetical protein